VGALPLSFQRTVLPVTALPQLVLPSTDVGAELTADAKAAAPVPVRFAVARSVELTPATSGTWEQLAEGRLWRLRLTSSGATDLNFGFTEFWLPEGASLYIISEGESYYQGPYTAADNTPSSQLWTPAVPGAAAIIELFLPAGSQKEPRLVLTQVAAGYRDLFHSGTALMTPKALSCEIDVACPQAAAWTNEIRSVARISIGGTTLCSGSLIMDSPRDFRPFFLTANHCGLTPANASSVVVYWNDQSPACGQHGLGGSLDQNQTGATFRAAKADVDFSLIELNQLPPAAYRVYYAGWDRSGAAPAGGVGIHHPNADGKCISFSTDPLTTIDGCAGVGGSNTHWQVTWTSGMTEPGSSGSGIWDPATHLLVGTLTGGGSTCPPTVPDCYGKFSVAWASGTQATNRLRDWLDPLKTGVNSVAGSVQAPAITNITLVGLTPQLAVLSPLGITNQVQYTTNLSPTKWVVLTNMLVAQSSYLIKDLSAASARQRFYRVVDTTPMMVVTLKQLWGSAGATNAVTNLIQRSSIPTPVNTAGAAFSEMQKTIWIPVSYVPPWTVGTHVYWGDTPYSMKVNALGIGQIQFTLVSGGDFGWSPGNLIVTSFVYSLSNVVTAAAKWTTPGVGNTVQVSASAVTASVGDVVWVGGVGANQFQIVSIAQ
jgi:hypothetical protein